MYYMYICNSGSIQANTEGKSILSVGSRVELSGGHGRNRHTFFLAELYVCEILFDARSQIFLRSFKEWKEYKHKQGSELHTP